MGNVLNKILNELLKNLKNIKPEEIREDLIQLREELIKAGGKPINARGSWNQGIRYRYISTSGFGRVQNIRDSKAGKWVKKNPRMQKIIRVPKDSEKELKEVIDVIPTEKTLDIYVHYPRSYTDEDISVKLDSSDREQKLHVTTPDTKTTIDIETRVKEKGIKWKLNNDTLIISLEKEEANT